MKKRKDLVNATIGIMGIIWVIFGIIAIVFNNLVLSVISTVALVCMGLVIGTNVDYAATKNNMTAPNGGWHEMSPRQKWEQVFAWIAAPFVLCMLYSDYHIIIKSFGPFNARQEGVYFYLLLMLCLITPIFIGMGVKKWFPSIAEKLSYS